MREWIPPALFAFLMWGLWGLLPKFTTRYINPQSAIFFEAIVGLPFALVVWAVLRGNLQTDPRGAAIASVTGIIGILGAFGFLAAVNRGPVSLVAAFTAVYPALTILLAMIFLGETLEPRQWLGVGMAMVAMFLVAL